MSTQPHVTTPAEMPISLVPPLETGDRMTRAEFERRYGALPGLKKAELVEGVVYVPPPVGKRHGHAHARLSGWLIFYADQTPGVDCIDNGTVRLDLENEVQPDALLQIAVGGQSKTGRDDFIEGAPELVAEVASSSVSRDLHAKLALYRRHGVQEYLVWRVHENDFDWFRLIEGNFELQAPDERGIHRSQVFPGLWLDKAALLGGNIKAVLATLNDGLASPEHAAFIAR